VSDATELETQTYTVTRADLVRYAHASGDHNPIHQDEDVARSVGLPGVIAHGMYTMALAARAVQTWFPRAEVLSIGCKFTNPVVVPAEGGVDVVVAGTASADGDGLTTVKLTVTSGGEKVLGMPKAVVRPAGQGGEAGPAGG
jgi:acyl dehydratase